MKNACFEFKTHGTPVSCERYGNGHINETYLVITDTGTWYILQKINHNVFKDVAGLMHNISSVTKHLYSQTPDPRRVLTIVEPKSGGTYIQDSEGYWRMYVFVTDSICLERPESPKDFFSSAVAFGAFQNQLSGFDAASLNETIKDFHNTPRRFLNLKKAIEEDKLGRAKTCQREIDFCMQREEICSFMTDLLDKGELKLRVTHNDTKLNNVMLDSKTREPLCVIDLDTVMPGLAANDFGDSIRFGASTAKEDEEDLSKVNMSLELYESYTKGFLQECKQALNEREIETLPMGALLMTHECGMRFLTDYLEGDTYFRIHRPDHNLIRCRTQFKLVEDMEHKMGDMQKITEKY
ncbi:MAG: aminoglycoside phosphotransferase family protein [Eubacteriales bacterium]|nr:aminoglycoside phosphotransferase family protein [Eubacteriales bacterium]